MIRQLTCCMTALLLGNLFSLQAEDKPAQAMITLYSGHFEKNNSGLNGEQSFLYFADAKAFEAVFGAVPPPGFGAARKNNPVAAGVFQKEAVVAVITRGDFVTTYTSVEATLEADTLKVNYKAERGPKSTATFASPLIISCDKTKFSKVQFIENGKEVGSAKNE